ncbi:hypothetical protein CR513_16187, partial [Mucuna pruriens]
MEAKGWAITWENFKRMFLEKYFLEYVENKKEMEFLELKQGSMIVVDYSTKFEELSRHFSHFQNEDGERSKCLKFINGLPLKIKQVVNYEEIKIYDEDTKGRVAHYKSVGPTREKRFAGQSCPKPYFALPSW